MLLIHAGRNSFLVAGIIEPALQPLIAQYIELNEPMSPRIASRC
jgi:hypothetical protein